MRREAFRNQDGRTTGSGNRFRIRLHLCLSVVIKAAVFILDALSFDRTKSKNLTARVFKNRLNSVKFGQVFVKLPLRAGQYLPLVSLFRTWTSDRRPLRPVGVVSRSCSFARWRSHRQSIRDSPLMNKEPLAFRRRAFVQQQFNCPLALKSSYTEPKRFSRPTHKHPRHGCDVAKHSPPMPRLIIENLTKTFRGPRGEEIAALKSLNLTVEDREFMVLVGPSGSGKSTTLRLIAGLEQGDLGNISLDGRIINGVAPKNREVALAFQNGALYPHLTVFENIAIGLKLRKFPKPEIRPRVLEAAESLGLTASLGRRPGDLSGGERQRVALGRAMVRQPKLFLFDEPLSNLDSPLRARLRGEIKELHRRLGTTTIYVTHDQAEAMSLGDRIAVLSEGAVQQVAEPLALYRSPANLFVAGFIGSPPMNLFPGTVIGKASELCFVLEGETNSSCVKLILPIAEGQGACLATQLGKKLILGLRPEEISAQSDPGPAAGPGSRLTARVVSAEFAGVETLLQLAVESHRFAARFPGKAEVEAGQSVPIHFDLSRAVIFDAGTGLAISCLA